MMFTSITDWRNYIQDGEKYLLTAENGYSFRPSIFNNEIVYNLVAMSIEKYFMGFLMSRGDLAENHTMADLVRAVENHMRLDQELVDGLLFIDSFQEICEIDTFQRRPPNPDEINRIIKIGNHVRCLVKQSLEN